MKTFLSLAAIVLLAAPSAALAANDEGVLVQICVKDEANAPVGTAVIRHPQEADRHRVNTTTGCWEDSVLYMPDGSELRFLPGVELVFEISAPNYSNETVKYIVRKRKNVISIRLASLNLDFQELEEDDPMIQFGRDKPIDGAQ